jgi:hypothetical protein
VDLSGQAVVPFGNDACTTDSRVVQRSIAYTTIGEGHANWDTKGGVEYNSTLSSEIEIAQSYGSTWNIKGTYTIGSSTGVRIGYGPTGPYFAKEFRAPIEYRKILKTLRCHSGGAGSSHSYYQILPGSYKVPAGGAIGGFGKDVLYKDGANNYYGSPKANRGYLGPHMKFTLMRGKSSKFQRAATVFGVSLSSATKYDREHHQVIVAGGGSSAHDVWGRSGPLSGNAGIIHSW